MSRQKHRGQFALSNVLYPGLFTVLLVGAWGAAIRVFRIPDYLLPAPYRVAQLVIIHFELFIAESAITLEEAILGFLLGASCGFVSAVVFFYSRPVELAIYPYAIALKTIPLVAVAPLLTIWFGTGLLGKVVMASLLCYFPVLVNTALGFRSVDRLQLAYFRSLAASPVQTFLLLRLPACLPYLFSALRISCTMSLVGAIVAELTGSNRGLGYQILASSYRLDTPRVFAAILCSGIIGIAFFGLIVLIERSVIDSRREIG